MITAFGDFLFAIIAGIAIFPAAFSFGVDPKAGPELAFITLPQIFPQMPGAYFVGAIFFLSLSAAAYSSMMALLEVPVALANQRLGCSRRTATAVIGILVFALGLPAAMSFGLLSDIQISGRGILDAVDTMVSKFLLPMGGILIAVFVGWHVNRTHALHDANLTNTRLGSLWIWLLRYLVPITITVILLQSIGVI